MKHRIGPLALAASIFVAFFIWGRAAERRPITLPQPAPGADELQSVTLVFGWKDMQPAPWDGSIAIAKGKIEKLVGHHFTTDATIDGTTWKAATHPWTPFAGGMHPNESPQPHASMVQTIGVTVHYRAPADAVFTVTVPKGTFSFRTMDIPHTGGIFPLQASVEVYRTPVVETVTNADYENDYASVATAGDKVWTVWQGYKDEKDRIFARVRQNNTWGERMEVSQKAGDLFGTAVAASGKQVMVAWSEHEGDEWHLRARMHDGARFGAVESVTSGVGHNLFHRMASDAAGGFHIVYQSWRRGRSDIYLRSYAGGKWQPEVMLSDSARQTRANDWMPSVTVDRAGTVWVAWDGYATGNYNIYMRAVKANRPGELIRVTTNSRFHAHASLAVDKQDRVWIAWEESGDNWGKDVGFLFEGGTGLYQSRTIETAVYAAGRWMTPLRQPDSALPTGLKAHFANPRLVADAAGRVWLLSRPRSSARLPTAIWAAGGKWEVYASYYDEDRWSNPIVVPQTVGRNEGEVQASADSHGNVWLTAVADHRGYGGGNFGDAPRNNEVMFAKLRAEGPVTVKLGARPPQPPSGALVEPEEREQVARIRNYRIQAGGKTYRIFRGDMHRHTEISADGAGDGSLWDAYRYAMDAGALDYLMVTDHQSGTQEYTWWRIEKSADMFHVPGFFTALYGTERSLAYPNGHRNLIFTKRGVRILPITPAEQKSSTGPILYPYLRKNNGIATSHTSATNMGTDWRDNDRDLEPMVEIYQGARTSGEHEGAPLAPTEARTELHAGGYRPLGFVWNAWAKGYKLGVQASSDHVSTHLSYACIIAEDQSRDALVAAMRQRHTYAATRNIVMDYRVSVDGNTMLQGDAADARGMPELTAQITAAGPLAKVVLVRDNQYIHSEEPKGAVHTLRFKENSLSPGEHYYYVRAEQKDGFVAWSSPVWLKYAGK